jgi:hypothetical protein
MPSFIALSSLLPGSLPATTKLVFFETLDEVLPPSRRICSSISVRLNRSMVPVTTNVFPLSRAGDSRPDMVGRPGCNAVRLRKIIEVDEKTFEALRQILPIFSRSEMPKPDVTLLRMPAEGGNPPALIKKSNRVFAAEEVYKNDQDRIVREIINASRLADYVVVNIHSHQPGNYSVKPPEFMKDRNCLLPSAPDSRLQAI